MVQDENPLDRISSGPAPTGPNPWRSDRLPTGSPYSSGRSGTGGVRHPRRLGLAGWLTLVAAVVLLAGAVGWAAVSKSGRDDAGPLPGITGAATPPPAPSVDQISANSLFTTTLTAPATCPLPAWSTDRAAMQAFSQAATACLGGMWRLPTSRVEVFDPAPDGTVAGACTADKRIQSIITCDDVTMINYERARAGIGSQAGAALMWLSLDVAGRTERRSGVSADVDALVRTAGGPTSDQGAEYLRRRHLQNLCLAGATLTKLVGHGIQARDMEEASSEAASWTVISATSKDAVMARGTAQSWFDRGRLSPTQDVCRTAWSVPVDQVS
ncbi:hypothetical protein [Tsukamurella paurometabola]|uniref:Predicted metalloprotease n=1 Tax=Tsukamurella paurometabola TaxID=2061 RepID=A0A3P8MBQ5_TSUPA|nr:hypothetical protein [Tsukamurella paurometabola]MBS4102540.1 hypothetical protein [Tsukamurella paurometabola]UEA81249.1 hypothetical protein LK411_12555 [Tsukamurella paurometabola]VDR38226.1 Predicted metalloprotease [Tsukamurella paurometabola]